MKPLLKHFPIRTDCSVKLLHSGSEFFDFLLNAIHLAKHEIIVQIYIFDHDQTAQTVFESLVAAAKRGVVINLLLDAYGSKSFPNKWRVQLEAMGGKVQFYSPFYISYHVQIGMRLHHKIIVIDQSIGMIGGINIGNAYHGYNNKLPWLDFALAMQGSVIKDLVRVSRRYQKDIHLKALDHEAPFADASKVEKARIIETNWIKGRIHISRQYRHAIRREQHEIFLLSSYFLPSASLKRLLKKKATLGVNVRIILGGVSDVPIVQRATHYFYRDLLKAGVQLFEYKEAVLHGKLAFTSNWFTIGSYNLNQLSDFGSIECNIEIMDAAYCQRIKTEMQEQVFPHCQQVEEAAYLHHSHLLDQFVNWCCYRLVSMSFSLMFFLQKHIPISKD